jgi:hypothetical protein
MAYVQLLSGRDEAERDNESVKGQELAAGEK